MSLLKHNEPDSLLRRLSGLSDIEWSWLVETAEINTIESKIGSPFINELVNLLIERDEPNFTAIKKTLGITDRDNTYSNWQHIYQRLYRYLCPEELRAGCEHTAIPSPVLFYHIDSKEFMWSAEFKLTGYAPSALLELAYAKVNDKLLINVYGRSRIDSVTVSNYNTGDCYDFYPSEEGASFGKLMYILKSEILRNIKADKKVTKE